MDQQIPDGHAVAPAINAAPANIAPVLNRLAVRTPPFWKINPRLWFRQMEGQFATAGIVNDLTKFNTVIDSDILSTVSDIVLTPPAHNLYDTLKAKLIKQFTDSDPIKLKTLFQELQLGDGKPSDLLRKMRELSCDKVGNDLLKDLWIQRLPPTIQAIVSSNEGTLEQLTVIADRIFDTTQFKSIQSISNTPNDALLNVIQQLSHDINALKSNYRDRSAKTKRTKSFHNSQSEDDSEDKICWYHKVYKHKANKCQPPCPFSENSTASHVKRQQTQANR